MPATADPLSAGRRLDFAVWRNDAVALIRNPSCEGVDPRGTAAVWRWAGRFTCRGPSAFGPAEPGVKAQRPIPMLAARDPAFRA